MNNWFDGKQGHKVSSLSKCWWWRKPMLCQHNYFSTTNALMADAGISLWRARLALICRDAPGSMARACEISSSCSLDLLNHRLALLVSGSRGLRSWRGPWNWSSAPIRRLVWDHSDKITLDHWNHGHLHRHMTSLLMWRRIHSINS